MTHTRIWSTVHLKASCWYIDCGKIFCPVEEEDAKKACVQVVLKGAALDPNQGEEQEDVVEVDISQLPKKERNKILNQKIREAEKAKEKAEKEAK
jgi:DNA replicative helicase MCM subunit Mcm2 (Cdc46/Mcm family)